MIDPNLESFVWNYHVSAHPDGHRHENQQKHLSPRFCHESVNSSLEEIINIKVIAPPDRAVRGPQ